MKSKFTVVYIKGQLRFESFGLSFFTAEGHPSGSEYAFDVDVKSNFDLRTARMWVVNATIPTKSFVIESVPNPKLGDCWFSRADGLKPFRCNGKIALRGIRNDDWWISRS